LLAWCFYQSILSYQKEEEEEATINFDCIFLVDGRAEETSTRRKD
jgi:hypothetical protein